MISYVNLENYFLVKRVLEILAFRPEGCFLTEGQEALVGFY